MSPIKFIQTWSVAMAKVKKAIEHLRPLKKLNIEFIPFPVSKSEFQEAKEEVQNIITKMLIASHKRGRPSKNDDEELDYAS